MNERTIQHVLYLRNHQRFKVLMPNYTPSGWWECDMFGVTKSGYFHEFEIKLTIADFRRDASKKAPDTWRWVDGQKQTVTGASKHSQIGTALGPSRFWYVVPEALIDQSEVPKWAGLQFLLERHGSYYARPIVQAPQLHRVKISDDIVRHSMSVCYYRYWHERQALDLLQSRKQRILSFAAVDNSR